VRFPVFAISFRVKALSSTPPQGLRARNSRASSLPTHSPYEIAAETPRGLATKNNRSHNRAEDGYSIDQKFEIFRCRDEHLEDETVLSCYPMDLNNVRDFRELLKGRLDIVVRGTQPDDRHCAQPKGLHVEANAISFDDAVLFKSPDTLGHGRLRQADLTPKGGQRRSTVTL
jgi:hypothetical protein